MIVFLARYARMRQWGHFCSSAYSRSQSSQRTHSVTRIRAPSMAPHWQAFWQIRHVPHSDQRAMRNTVRYDSRPSVAPTGQRNRQYRFRTKTVATSRTPRPIHIGIVSNRPNIQKGST